MANVVYKLKIAEIMKLFNDNTILYDRKEVSPILGEFSTIFPRLTYYVVSLIAGITKKRNVNYKIFSKFGSHDPAGSSLQCLIHW